MAEMKVSWKQSSASWRPTAAKRERRAWSRCVRRRRWKGGGVTSGLTTPNATRRSVVRFVERGEPAQERRRAVALLAVLVGQPVEHRDDEVEPHRVRPLQRPPRVVEPEDHPRVDVLR